jgi:hypothetical protein
MRPAALAAILVTAAAAQAPELRAVDTGLGFAVSIPASWVVGKPSGKNRFVAGSGAEDFSLVVSDFGPTPADATEADRVYRDCFARFGLALVTTSEVAVSGASRTRYVFALKTDGGDGHAEAVMVPLGGTTYGVLVVTASASADARRGIIARMLESIDVGGRATAPSSR